MGSPRLLPTEERWCWGAGPALVVQAQPGVGAGGWGADAASGPAAGDPEGLGANTPVASMPGEGTIRLGRRAVMYTAETIPKGKNRVMGTIQIMMGFMHIGFGIVLTTITNVYTSVFVIGEIPFLGGVSFIISGCLSIGAEKNPTECAVKGSQTMNVISAIFALLGIVAFIIDLNINGLYHSNYDYYNYLVMAGNGISIVLLIFTILEFCIAVATALFWCRATRLNSHESMLIVPNTIRADLMVPTAELPHPPTYSDTAYDPKDQSEWGTQERT
ncbi:membrane-spanning 4-domains subfamily A member 15-like [Trachemys scripta elegans]|uniref:membrane-spanning 4-domains subfamily A member 15-like n=1 Tax=Trachemys scripta elegans TaxID=31138 RepID=UPI001555A2F5|nr:membrane-spanning 4-domains subfamily A member 15-like [Trachemys scripta elegans]